MLIVNDNQLLLAGGVSLNEPCPYCSRSLRSYPLILADDAAQTVYHAACAVELETSILVDLFILFSPPAPCAIGPIVAERREKGATPGADPWLGSLVHSGKCAH